jgi:hypothetical protein
LKKFVSAIFLFFLSFNLSAQQAGCWNVLLLEKDNKLEVKPDMQSFSKTGFYLYKNCFYEFDLKNKMHISGRLVNIKPDTLYFTNFFNAEAANRAKSKLDTEAVSCKNLERLCLIEDRAYGLYAYRSLADFDFIFKKDTGNYSFKPYWVRIYMNDTASYEIVPNLTGQGIDFLFEQNGNTYYYYGPGMVKPDLSKMDYTYRVRKVFWYTPCKVEEINGVALGLHAKNIKNSDLGARDSLAIRGLHLEINPFEVFGLPTILQNLSGPCPDSINIYNEKISSDWQVKLHGVQLSVVNTINEMRLEGVNITGAFTIIDEIRGVSISGINNFSYIMNGVSIAGIRNRATSAKGVQIALINKATDLHGFQFGLWNVNGQRSLPFINWQFKAKKKK